jgi:YHS domain-containing protein
VKSALFLAGTVALCTGAAAWRWPDSAHAMGVVKRSGGEARHAVNLPSGPERYQIVLTAPVLPGWRGDARLELEGEPATSWGVELTQPVVDLGLRRWPRLEGKVLRDLAPGDRLALWVDLEAPLPGAVAAVAPAAAKGVDPVCGMTCAPGLVEGEHCFCSEACRSRFEANPGAHAHAHRAAVAYKLVLRDEATRRPVLTVPINLGGEGGGHGAHH